MSIGYACLTIGVPNTDIKSCMMKNASDEKLLELIAYNLNSLENIIDYNVNNNILLFRISSGIIPFGSSSVNQLKWWEIFEAKLSKIGQKIKNNNLRVSMHPGQYTVLNTPKKEVLENSIADLRYHWQFLKSLGVNDTHKIIIHIGGMYGDKNHAMKRFICHFGLLDKELKQRIVIENDDKSYNINDVLEIGSHLSIPVVYDNLHNYVNPYNKNKADNDWINECEKTWKVKDGLQKIHYSQQEPFKKPGSHSNHIDMNEFIRFYEILERDNIDIMLEVKDKNLSAIQCINYILNKKLSSIHKRK
ncbi:MAG: UV DNA damage repair endonuclease UvsE [Anaerovorax sp.]|nr:UV DNA damage repair endonuclease UvsE [Anaerovorax sp.]